MILQIVLSCMLREWNLSNGFSELNNPFDQAERFHDQAQARAAGEDETHFYDADYVTALEYGYATNGWFWYWY